MTNREAIREAIENLKGCVVSYEVDEHGNPNGNVTADLTMEIINMAISALEKQEKDGWIPVTERMPESDHDDLEYPTVLVSIPNSEVCTACYYESTKEWGTGEDYDRICYPTAWRPLPEPYTEEES